MPSKAFDPSLPRILAVKPSNVPRLSYKNKLIVITIVIVLLDVKMIRDTRQRKISTTLFGSWKIILKRNLHGFFCVTCHCFLYFKSRRSVSAVLHNFSNSRKIKHLDRKWNTPKLLPMLSTFRVWLLLGPGPGLRYHAFQRKSDSIARQVVTQEQWLRFRYFSRNWVIFFSPSEWW